MDRSGSKPTGPWRTVIVEEQSLLRTMLAKLIRLDARFELLAEVEDGVEGQACCLRFAPDLVVMDAQLPRPDGVELAASLRQSLPRTRVLALSRKKDPFTVDRLSKAGVHGFVETDQPLEILEEAMIEVASGKTYFTAAFCRNQEKLRSDPCAFVKILSEREQEITSLVAAGLTSREIASRLNLSPRSVETYRYRIMRKLEIENVAGLVEYALRNGLARTEAGADPASRS